MEPEDRVIELLFKMSELIAEANKRMKETLAELQNQYRQDWWKRGEDPPEWPLT